MLTQSYRIVKIAGARPDEMIAVEITPAILGSLGIIANALSIVQLTQKGGVFGLYLPIAVFAYRPIDIRTHTCYKGTHRRAKSRGRVASF